MATEVTDQRAEGDRTSRVSAQWAERRQLQARQRQPRHQIDSRSNEMDFSSRTTGSLFHHLTYLLVEHGADIPSDDEDSTI